MRTAAAIGAGLAAILAVAAPPASDLPIDVDAPPAPEGARGRARSLGRGDGGTPDGGTRRSPRNSGPRILGDPPGTMRLTNTPEPDAGVPAVAAGSSKTEAELAALRARVGALESQLGRVQDQADQLGRLNQQMADLRAQLGADAQQQRDQQAQRAVQRQRVDDAVLQLSQADAVLSTGSEDIEGALQAAETALTGEAQRDVGNAREALRNRDLTAARYWLSAAASQARRGP